MKTEASPTPALATAAAGLFLGAACLWLGLDQGAVALWAFGAASLLLGLPSLVVWLRIREGFGNRGLERERLTLRAASHLLRLLALGAALTAGASLMGGRSPQPSVPGLVLALLALLVWMPLWWMKRGRADLHPSLAMDASRTRALLESAALLLAARLLGLALPWADGAAGLAMAVRLFIEGQALAKGTALQAASCGSCGNCGCG